MNLLILSRFEDSMTGAEEDKKELPRNLKTLLTGVPLAALTRSIPGDKKREYATLKKALLNLCGLSVSDYTSHFFSQYKKSSWTWAEAGHSVEFEVERLASGCDTLKDANTRISIAGLLTWCSQECASFVRMREPTMVVEVRLHGEIRQNSGRKWSTKVMEEAD